MNQLGQLLMVEDNADDFEAAQRSFKKHHFLNPVGWCRDGQDALDYLRRTGKYAGAPHAKTDLILLDLNMPGLDGRKTLKILKGDPALKTIPVVILTTSNDQRDIDNCYELGASTYIQKPVNFEGLAQAIRTMTDYWFGIAILPSAMN
jgi:CheY-like chemotaxis protein